MHGIEIIKITGTPKMVFPADQIPTILLTISIQHDQFRYVLRIATLS